MNRTLETAVFGGGCFWCTEAIFKELRGVESVQPGYSGAAESIAIMFDPSVISYRDLLDVFFGTHDPTTLNRQGNDVGEKYRSVIFYTSAQQKKQADGFISTEEQIGTFGDPIVTEVQPFGNFQEAEEYHKDFYAKNPNQSYCTLVINPKLQKFKDRYKRFLK
jgi:peptide-methionine (S)-S-oxide reductase